MPALIKRVPRDVYIVMLGTNKLQMNGYNAEGKKRIRDAVRIHFVYSVSEISDTIFVLVGAYGETPVVSFQLESGLPNHAVFLDIVGLASGLEPGVPATNGLLVVAKRLKERPAKLVDYLLQILGRECAHKVYPPGG